MPFTSESVLVQKNCILCGSLFTTSNVGTKCTECKKIQCRTCGELFVPNEKKTKFCSMKCRQFRNTSPFQHEHREGWCKFCTYRTDLEFGMRISYLFFSAKVRAKQHNTVFTISKKDILDVYPLDNICPILLKELTYETIPGRKTFWDTSPTLDKLNPSLGYTRENIAVISFRANVIKNNCYDPEVFRRVACFIESHAKKISTDKEQEVLCNTASM